MENKSILCLFYFLYYVFNEICLYLNLLRVRRIPQQQDKPFPHRTMNPLGNQPRDCVLALLRGCIDPNAVDCCIWARERWRLWHGSCLYGALKNSENDFFAQAVVTASHEKEKRRQGKFSRPSDRHMNKCPHEFNKFPKIEL